MLLSYRKLLEPQWLWISYGLINSTRCVLYIENGKYASCLSAALPLLGGAAQHYTCLKVMRVVQLRVRTCNRWGRVGMRMRTAGAGWAHVAVL